MRLTLRNYLALLALGALALFSSCSSSPASAQARIASSRKPAAEFTLKDANGASVKLSDYRGKVVLLNFWATWCGPCALEIPWFVEFEQQYKSQGFAVLGVSMDEEGWSAIKPFVAEHKVNYRVLLGNDTVSDLYGGVDALPTTFIIDQYGRVAFPPHIGLVDKSEYVSEIQSLLGEGSRDRQTTSTSRASFHSVPAAMLLGPAK
ncbi:MAG TPA: TlpA disulfide reductase family protein [Bryobacteraceae bacterium]|jgi:cytochrome c biogenesis protein CcmG/thiol:disulfide interchange protein DsbE